MAMKSAICIGGPLDGRRFESKDGSGFTVPKQVRTDEDDQNHEDYKPNAAAKVDFNHYKAETFHTPQGDVEFWVPVAQTPLETITRLLAAYERQVALRCDLIAARDYFAGYASDPMNHPQGKENAAHLYDKIAKTLNQPLT